MDVNEVMEATMGATMGAMAPILSVQMMESSAKAIQAFLEGAESAKRLGELELHDELIVRARKLLTTKGGE